MKTLAKKGEDPVIQPNNTSFIPIFNTHYLTYE